VSGGYPSEAYVLAQGDRGWCVYYSERGQRSGLVEFGDEGAACLHLLALIERDPTTRS
jgi:hypothetical protein